MVTFPTEGQMVMSKNNLECSTCTIDVTVLYSIYKRERGNIFARIGEDGGPVLLSAARTLASFGLGLGQGLSTEGTCTPMGTWKGHRGYVWADMDEAHPGDGGISPSACHMSPLTKGRGRGMLGAIGPTQHLPALHPRLLSCLAAALGK